MAAVCWRSARAGAPGVGLAGAGDPAARCAGRGRLSRRLRALWACACAIARLRHAQTSDLGDPVATGTPYFTARNVPCEMCEDIPASRPADRRARPRTDRHHASAHGPAALVDQENCLNFLGLRCDVCYRVCPVIDKAITLETRHNPRSDRHALLLPTVHSDACTGCGKCEKSCVLPEAAIKVFPQTGARRCRRTTARAGKKRHGRASR